MSETDLFLPAGYRENAAQRVDGDGDGYWDDAEALLMRSVRRYQDPVYRFAARLARRRDPRLVLDVGCGTGQNLVHRVGRVTDRTVGVDQVSAIATAQETFPDRQWVVGDLRSESVWDDLRALRADLVVCADVIEHVEDPRRLLSRLRSLLDDTGVLVLSTPDRDRTEGQDPLGPPRNPAHVREWSFAEMQRLLEASGFAIRSSRHLLPRRYRPSTLEAKIIVWRAVRLRPVPGRRSSMVFELARA